MKIGILVLMVLALVILIGLFVFSFKMLRKVHQQEKLERATQKLERTLHPKLKEKAQHQSKDEH